MIQLSAQQRKRTALLMLAFSALGVIPAAYLFHGAYVLLLGESPAGIGVTVVYALAGLFAALLTLLYWLGAYCLTHRYALSVTRSDGEVEIVTDAGKFRVSSDSVRIIWRTGKMSIAGTPEGVAFMFILAGHRLFVCARENAVGIA